MADVSAPRVLAIDGPAGAGKSSTARALAECLGFVYVDSGAMYRALAVMARREGVAADSEEALMRLLDRMEFSFDPSGRLFVGAEDLSDEIRSAEASRGSSAVAAHPAVRQRMVSLQRRMAEQAGSVVMDGRDIGTVVCPESPVKLFLDAELEERARRRIRQLNLVPTPEELLRVTEAIRSRDERDASREAAPLRAAPDAVRIDTTGLTFDAQLARCLDEVRRHWPPSWGEFRVCP